MEVCETGSFGVVGDGLIDFEGQGQGGAAVFGGDLRRLADADGFEERFDFEAQRLGRVHLRLVEGEGRCCLRHGGGRGCSRIDGDSIYIDNKDIFAGVVDGDVLVGLEEAELADPLGADAAGSEIGDAAGIEFKPHVGDVDFAGENGQADSVDFSHGRPGEAEDDVQVMDHEIKDHINVEGSGPEYAEAMRLKEHRSIEQRLDSEDSRVESLKMAGLQDAVVLPGEGDEVVGLLGGGGEGLLDDYVDMLAQQWRGDGEVRGRWDADGGGVDADFVAGARGEGCFNRGVDGNVEFLLESGDASGVGFNDGGERNTAALFQFAIDAKMVATEGSSSADGYVNGHRRRRS